MNLAKHLTERGDEVLMVSRGPMRGASFTLGLESEPRFSYRVAHLVAQLDEALAILDGYEPEQIINFAALCELGASWKYPLNYFNTNTMAMVALVEELQKRTYLKRFVQVGTSEVYGSVTVPATEDDAIRCSSPYAASKAAFDLHLAAVAKHQGFPAIIIRPSNGYCEGQALNRIIPRTILAGLTGARLQLQGGGIAQKSYLHGDDISSAIMLLMEKGVIGDVYNAGPSWPISIRSLVTLLAADLGKSFSDVAEIVEERLGQDSVYRLNSNKIAALGWHPKIALREGLPMMIEWVKRYPELLGADTAYRHAA